MLSRKAHLDSGEPSFTDQNKSKKKTTCFLSLVKPSPIHFLSHVGKKKTHSSGFFCGLLLAKEDIDVPLQKAALQEMWSLVRMISQQASKEVYLMWSQRQKGSGTETNKMTQRQQKDSWHLMQVTHFFIKLVL